MPAFIPKGKANYGDDLPRDLSARMGGKVATTALLTAIPPRARADGMLMVVHPAALWVFDAASSAGASATVLVPDAGTGRWIAATLPA